MDKSNNLINTEILTDTINNKYTDTDIIKTDDTIIQIPKKIIKKMAVIKGGDERIFKKKLDIMQDVINKKNEEIQQLKNNNSNKILKNNNSNKILKLNNKTEFSNFLQSTENKQSGGNKINTDSSIFKKKDNKKTYNKSNETEETDNTINETD